MRDARSSVPSFLDEHGRRAPDAALGALRARRATSASCAVESWVWRLRPRPLAQTLFQVVLMLLVSRSKCVGPPGTRFFSAIGTLYLMSLPSMPSTQGRTAFAIGTIARRFRLWTRPGWFGSIRFRLRSMFASVSSRTASGRPAVPSSTTMKRIRCSRSGLPSALVENRRQLFERRGCDRVPAPSASQGHQR